MTFKIEKNLPIARVKKAKAIYPFGGMEVGDSFEYDAVIHNKVTPAACCYGKRHNKKFSIRKIDDKKYRIWRIK